MTGDDFFLSLTQSGLAFCQLPSYELTALQADCKLVWIQIIVGNGSKLFLGGYYRPHIDDQHSIDELGLSLQQLNETTSDAKVWLVGDFNAPKGV